MNDFVIDKLKILSELTKIRITIFVTVTTALGYICYAEKLGLYILVPLVGILFLSCGSAAVNHIQERNTDALMHRTMNRPLPSGRISPKNAWLIALSLIILGSIILYFSGIVALLLGLLNLIWYNLVYTPLKKVSALAIIPGSLVGAIPPMIGWAAAGGSLTDPRILFLALFFFIWQIPHFWLLLLVLSNDYERAGFPTLTKIFDKEQLSRITFMWILATIVIGLMIPFFGLVKFPLVNILLLIPACWLTIKAVKLLTRNSENISFTFAFREINLFVLAMIFLLSIDKILI
jgi:heme o synthase